MIAGYARVSLLDQELQRQLDSLKNYGCEKIFTEKVSGMKQDRPELKKLLSFLREGDVLVVHSLDRLGRSLIDLIKIVEDLKARKIDFVCIAQNYDTTTPSGKMLFRICATFAEYERDYIAERTKEGQQAAKNQGRLPGRRRKLSDSDIEMIKSLLPNHTKIAIAKRMNVSEKTIRRALKGLL